MKRFRKLNDEELQTKSELLQQLSDKSDAINEAIEEFNSQIEEAITKLWQHVEDAVEEYNKVVSDANEFIQEIQEYQQQYYNDREDKWKEGDAGNSYQTWMSYWEDLVEDAVLDSPSSLEVKALEIDHKAFDELPHKVAVD